MTAEQNVRGMTMELIAERSPESQKRIWIAAEILRELLIADQAEGDVMLAFTIVMAEVSE